MKIGFVSDTHGRQDSLKRVVDFLGDYDAIIHTGDVLAYGVDYPCFISEYIKELKNIYFVRGNTDYFDADIINKESIDYDSIFNIYNLKIFATHGFIKSIGEYEKLALKNKCDILVYGHSHIKKLEKKGNLVVLNPGSTAFQRDGIPSFAVLDDDIIKMYDLRDFSVISKLKINNTNTL